MLLGTGSSLTYITVTDPLKSEELIYGAKTTLETTVENFKEKSTGELPTLYLEGRGTVRDLNATRHKQFVQMTTYETVPELIPFWAAHNNRGGDYILSWEVGKKFNVVGSGYDGVWVVSDVMKADKYGRVDQAVSLQGLMGLQTCYYGQPYVKLVGIVPLEQWEDGRWLLEDEESEVTVDSDVKFEVE